MVGAVLPILAGLGSGLAAMAMGEHAATKKREAIAHEKERELLTKKAEKLAEAGDHESYEAIIPHLQQIGASPNIIDAGRQIARSRAKQIYEQEIASGMEPSVKLPPNMLSSLIQGQQGGTAAGDYLAQASSPEVAAQRTATGLPPVSPELNEFRARAFTPPPAPAPAAPPTPAGGITVPPMKAPVSRTIQTPTGSITSSYPGTTGKEVTASVISQARTQDLHPRQIHVALDVENARRLAKGQPALDPDDPAIVAYDTEHFETTQNRIRQNLEGQGMDPMTAMKESAQKAYDETGLLPEKWKSVIEPKEGQLGAQAYINAVTHASDVISQLKSPAELQSVMKPGFLSDAITRTSNLKPEDSVRAHHAVAENLVQQLLPKLKQQFPTLSEAQVAGKAMQLAAYATGGEVPKEWHDAVMGNPKALGFSEGQAAIMAATGINPLEPGAGKRAQDAEAQLTLKKEFQKTYMEKTTTPEGSAAAYQQLQGGKGGPGEIDRAIQLEQKGKVEEQQKTIERKYAIAPPGEMDKLKPLDDLYTTGVRIQQLALQKDSGGRTLVDKYGSTPGTFVDWYRKASGALGETDPQLRKYTSLLGKIFNVEKKTFAGVAVNLNERKDLLQFMPDPTDNVRTGLDKLNTLIQMAGTELERDLGLIQENYPATKLESFNYRKIKQAREAQKAK